MLILHGRNCNLLKNEYGFFEVWSNGQRLFEILTENEKDACEQFAKFTGETWQLVEH